MLLAFSAEPRFILSQVPLSLVGGFMRALVVVLAEWWTGCLGDWRSVCAIYTPARVGPVHMHSNARGPLLARALDASVDSSCSARSTHLQKGNDVNFS